MKVWIGAKFLALSAALLLTISAGQAQASDVEDQGKSERVAAALEAEVEGDFLKRQRLLSMSEDFAPAKWQTGHVFDGEWQDVDASIEDAKQNQLLIQYEQRRSSLRDTMQNHLALARWCSENGLLDQCRAHLNRVLSFEPNHQFARSTLGYRRLGNEWLSPEQLAEIQADTQFAVNSIKEYGARVRRIIEKLEISNEPNRKKLQVELAAIKDSSAVPAVESALSAASPRVATESLSWFSSIDTARSSKSLSRFATFHPEQRVREKATELLADRPFHDFVPELLRMLESPASMMVVPVVGTGGRLMGYRQAFAKEKIDKTEFLIVNQNYNSNVRQVRVGRMPVPDASVRLSLAESLNADRNNVLARAATAEVRQRKEAADAENRNVLQRNQRVGTVVSAIAKIERTSDPKTLWQWWDKYNDTEYQRFKPQEYRVSNLETEVPLTTFEPNFSCECFVAGTAVVTRMGAKAIEKIAVGDQVLSRNVRTGELGWKPVLRVTMRPPEQVIQVNTGDDKLRCTEGHLFWVSGKGWCKAKELEDGDTLHAANTPGIVLSTQKLGQAQTFNLQVADNATYFVGEGRIMTHDVTPRSHNRQRVPGERLLLSRAAK